MTEEVLDRFARGDLEDRDLFEVVRHLETCPSCARAGQKRAASDLAALRAELTGDTGEVRTARSRARVTRIAILATAAAVALIVLGLLLRRPSTPDLTSPLPRASTASPVAPQPRASGRPEWVELVKAARSGKPLVIPEVLMTLRGEPEVLRGHSDRDAGREMYPWGVIVDTARPRFTWTAPNGDRSVVAVFVQEREIVRSGELSTPAWMPPSDLARGVTYTWQVEIERDGKLRIIPAPPAPPARFHVLDAASHDELENARMQQPPDPLLLGILHARAGLVEDARRHLSNVTAPPDLPVAQRLLRELDSWRASQPVR